jgi:predicted transcriptional regulator
MDQNLTILLFALIGGSMAIASGFVVKYMTGKTAAKNEKVMFIRSKLEELHKIIEEVQEVQRNTFDDLDDMEEEITKSHVFNNLNSIDLLLKRFEAITTFYIRDLPIELKRLFETLNHTFREITEKFSNDGKYAEQEKEKYLEFTSETYLKIHSVLSSFAKRKGISEI